MSENCQIHFSDCNSKMSKIHGLTLTGLIVISKSGVELQQFLVVQVLQLSKMKIILNQCSRFNPASVEKSLAELLKLKWRISRETNLF